MHPDDNTSEENSSLGKEIRYLNNHFDGMTAFCRIPSAQLDNNKMENQFKRVIIDRKNTMFRKTHTGADIGDVITSLIATAQGLAPMCSITSFTYNENMRK